jgi:hypothetical protein
VAELTGESARAAMEVSGQQRQQALLYVLDRFIDCTAAQPPENFEELPASGLFTVGTPVASAKNLEGNPGLAPAESQGTVHLYAAPPEDSGRSLPADKEAETPNPP